MLKLRTLALPLLVFLFSFFGGKGGRGGGVFIILSRNTSETSTVFFLPWPGLPPYVCGDREQPRFQGSLSVLTHAFIAHLANHPCRISKIRQNTSNEFTARNKTNICDKSYFVNLYGKLNPTETWVFRP